MLQKSAEKEWQNALDDFERFSEVFELSESAKSILRLSLLLVDIQYRVAKETNQKTAQDEDARSS